MSTVSRRPHLTNKVLRGLERIFDKPPLLEFITGRANAIDAEAFGLTDSEIEDAHRARRWVRDMVRYRLASGATADLYDPPERH